MADTNYIDYVQPAVSAEWLNEVNDHVWHDTPVLGTTTHQANKISNTPSGFITSTNVQTALNELGTKVSQIISVKDAPYNAVGNGIADDTIAINSANSAATVLGKTLFFPAGTYITSGIPAIAGMSWLGESKLTTIIKLKTGTNAGLVTSATATMDDISIVNMRFDGNAANNTAGDVLTIKGWQPTLSSIVIVNSPGKGMVTEAGTVSAERQLGPCGHIHDILIDCTQEEGWIHNGGSDADVSDVVVIDAGLKTHNTYIGIAFNTSIRGRNIHYWNRSSTTNVPSVGVHIGGYGGCNFSDSHFEGGVLPLSVTSNGNTFESCAYYAPRGVWALSVTGTGNKVSGVTGIGAHHLFLSYKGLYLGGLGNTVDLVDVGCLNGSIEFGGSEANNKVNIGGYRASGSIIVGTPSITDDINTNVAGPGGGYSTQIANAAWTSYTPTVTSGAGAFTTVSATGFYKQVGKTVNFRIIITVTTVGTASFSTQFTLPVTAKSDVGQVSGRERSVGTLLLGWLQSTTLGSIQKYDGTFIGASGTSLYVSGCYEAA